MKRFLIAARAGICSSSRIPSCRRPLQLAAFPCRPHVQVRNASSRAPTSTLPRHVDLNVEPVHPFRSKQFTITTQTPNILKPEQVLEEIRYVKDSGQFEELGSGLPTQDKTVVILSTPTLATWLQNNHFIPDVLRTIFPPESDTTEVQAILAVVDGLSPSPTGMHRATKTAEGFSLMVCVGDARVPAYECKDQVDLHRPETTQVPSISFHLYDGNSSVKEASTLIDIAMPLANTVFRNGQASTLLLQRWGRSPSSQEFHQIESRNEHSWSIPTEYSRVMRGRKYGKFPLKPLTVPKPIASGMGNIVRELVGSDGETIPASQELEKSVISYLDENDLPQQTVSVWAWIMPESLFHHERIIPNDSVDVRFWRTLRQGAGFHRVLSGGGGWGSKAGLLSLDPSVTVFPTKEAYSDFPGGEISLNADEAQRRALGDIAKPGSFVQFMIADEPLDGSIQVGKPSKRYHQDDPTIRLGCIPSTIDDIPSTLPEGHEEGASTVTCTNYFSPQSEGGLFLRVKDVTEEDGEKKIAKTHCTKLDVPGSMIIGHELEEVGRAPMHLRGLDEIQTTQSPESMSQASTFWDVRIVDSGMPPAPKIRKVSGKESPQTRIRKAGVSRGPKPQN